MTRAPILFVLAIVVALAIGVAGGAWFFGQRAVSSSTQERMAEAEAAYERQDYAAVLEMLTPLANQGDGLAQHRLGLMYASGLGVDKNPDLAITWLSKALDNQITAAKELLIDQFDQKARAATSISDEIAWYQRALELDGTNAQAVLGSYYLVGKDLDRDGARALDLLTKAAQKNDVRAMTNLGYLYASGTATEVDYETAHQWYLRAAEGGMVRAQTAVAALYESGRGVEKNLPEAARWYMNAASAGEVNAKRRLGSLIAAGTVEPPTPEAGVAAVTAAAANGDAVAFAWLEEAAKSSARAQGQLAELMFAGGAKQDKARASRLLIDAAERGDPVAQQSLGRRYATGEGVEQDYVFAHKWINLAATGGNPEAIELRDTFVQFMTPEQVATAQQLAREWTAQRQNERQ